MTKRMRFISIITLILVFIPGFAFARAGGGSSGGGGGIVSLILLPFFLIYSAILTYQVKKKSAETKELLKKISEFDSSWNFDNIKNNIETAFFKLQEAWMERNQDIAKDYLSQSLYEKHKTQTDNMIKAHEKNILRNISLLEHKMVQVSDYSDNSKDAFWVYIKGSMIDYTINDENGNKIAGKEDDESAFIELWKFIRSDNGWVVDEIDSNVAINDVKEFKSFSESI